MYGKSAAQRIRCLREIQGSKDYGIYTVDSIIVGTMHFPRNLESSKLHFYDTMNKQILIRAQK